MKIEIFEKRVEKPQKSNEKVENWNFWNKVKNTKVLMKKLIIETFEKKVEKPQNSNEKVENWNFWKEGRKTEKI